MPFNIVPWMLRGRSRPEYAARQSTLQEEPFFVDAGLFARYLAALVVLRFVFNLLLAAPVDRLAKQRGKTEQHKDGRKLLEELWVTLGNTALLAFAVSTMLHWNGGCSILDTSTCVEDWPNNEVDPAVTRYYTLELVWYLHLLLKPVFRYGLPDGRDMVIHHCATLALIIVSYAVGLTRCGVLVLVLFGISNPALHIAKICNQLNLSAIRMPVFGMFALLFFATRVVLVPITLVGPAIIDPGRKVPYALADFRIFHLIIVALLGILYLMQLIWMAGILRVLVSGVRHGGEAASHMSLRIDPAKRYGAAASTGSTPAEADADPATPRSKKGAVLDDSARVELMGPGNGKKRH